MPKAIIVDDRTAYGGIVAVEHSPVVKIRARFNAILQRGAFKAHEITAEVLSAAADVKKRAGDSGRVSGLEVLAIECGKSRATRRSGSC